MDTISKEEALQLRAEIFKALGHPTRLWIVERLIQGACCVTELSEGVNGGLSTLSQHLAHLRQAGIIRDERKGRQIYYTLTFPCVADLCACLGAPLPKRESALSRLRQMLPCVLCFLSLVTVIGVSFMTGQMTQLPPLPPHSLDEISGVAGLHTTKGNNNEDIHVYRHRDGAQHLRRRPRGFPGNPGHRARPSGRGHHLPQGKGFPPAPFGRGPRLPQGQEMPPAPACL